MAETPQAMAVRHVVGGRKIVDAQRKLIERLQQGGQDTVSAEELLEQFERSQAIFEDDLQRLEKR